MTISTFREPIRVLIGDDDPSIQLRENAQIDAAVRTVVDLGKVTGENDAAYALNAGRTAITPTFTAVSDPKAFAQAVYYAAKLFAVDFTPTTWRTRAFSESVGENKERVYSLLSEIYALENGEGCDSSDYPE
jgi:hypothetical protein